MRPTSTLFRALLVLALCAAGAGDARADHVHGIYLELFGKGGLWGLGYDHRLHRRIAIGAVGSYARLDGQRVLSLSPYLGLYLVPTRPHGWFFDVGPLGVHTWTQSPVPEWEGRSAAGIAASIATGYEYRSRVLVRVYAQGVAGAGGMFPWAGASLGCAF
jgi:hypothetical protein